MSDYEHHIFVSYRRSDEDWARWTRENFPRALAALLRPGIGNVKISIDSDIDAGASWPLHLARSLSRSRLMVALMSRAYFQSDWCLLELGLMQRREQEQALRTPEKPYGLIIPVVIDDGDCFPHAVQAMQNVALHEFANPFIRLDSPRQEALTEVLKRQLCPAIEKALEHVPPFDPSWADHASEHFTKTLKIQASKLTKTPSISLPQLP